MTTPIDRDQERKDLIKQYPLTYPLAVAAILIVIGIAIGYALFGADGVLASSDTGFWTNLYTEGISIAITILILNLIYERRANRERLQELITQMRSKDNGLALAAVEILRLKGWLTDGSLRGHHLYNANLRAAELHFAHLEKVNLSGANLSATIMQNAELRGADLNCTILRGSNINGTNLTGADICGADLTGATLVGSNLSRAKMSGCNLQSTDLWRANLEAAELFNAQLQDASLLGANLNNASITFAIFSVKTILPDGRYWTPDTDMARFTDPDHPHFWRSNSPHSPAYRES